MRRIEAVPLSDTPRCRAISFHQPSTRLLLQGQGGDDVDELAKADRLSHVRPESRANHAGTMFGRV